MRNRVMRRAFVAVGLLIVAGGVIGLVGPPSASIPCSGASIGWAFRTGLPAGGHDAICRGFALQQIGGAAIVMGVGLVLALVPLLLARLRPTAPRSRLQVVSASEWLSSIQTGSDARGPEVEGAALPDPPAGARPGLPAVALPGLPAGPLSGLQAPGPLTGAPVGATAATRPHTAASVLGVFWIVGGAITIMGAVMSWNFFTVAHLTFQGKSGIQFGIQGTTAIFGLLAIVRGVQFATGRAHASWFRLRQLIAFPVLMLVWPVQYAFTVKGQLTHWLIGVESARLAALDQISIAQETARLSSYVRLGDVSLTFRPGFYLAVLGGLVVAAGVVAAEVVGRRSGRAPTGGMVSAGA